MKDQGHSIVLFAIFAAILFTACEKPPPPFECTDTIACVDIAPGEPIKIGVIQALSGGAAPIGTTQAQGIELAIAQRGEQLLGHPIKLQLEDSLCTSEGGTNAALRIVTRPEVVAIVGTTCSGAATTAIEIISEAGLVMISGTNGAPSLTSVGGKQGTDWHPGYFRTMDNAAEMGRAAATFAFQKLQMRKAATINDGDVLTQQLTKVFEQTFTELGGNMVFTATVNKGDENMQPILTAVLNSQAEFVFLPIFQPEGDLIIKQARKIPELEHTIFMGDGALLVNTFIEAVNTDGLGMYFVGPTSIEGTANDTFIREYESKYGESPKHPSVSYTYDAINILLHAIETIAVQENNGMLHIGRQALRDTLHSISDFEGITGHLSCDTFGDCGMTRFNIVRLDDLTTGLKGLKANVIYTYTPKQ